MPNTNRPAFTSTRSVKIKAENWVNDHVTVEIADDLLAFRIVYPDGGAGGEYWLLAKQALTGPDKYDNFLAFGVYPLGTGGVVNQIASVSKFAFDGQWEADSDGEYSRQDSDVILAAAKVIAMVG